jgi:hypothetical protein
MHPTIDVIGIGSKKETREEGDKKKGASNAQPLHRGEINVIPP